jgi:hypothetical protein
MWADYGHCTKQFTRDDMKKASHHFGAAATGKCKKHGKWTICNERCWYDPHFTSQYANPQGVIQGVGNTCPHCAYAAWRAIPGMRGHVEYFLEQGCELPVAEASAMMLWKSIEHSKGYEGGSW